MKIQRLIAILTILLRTDCVPASKLAEKFEVSVRTIYRDVEVLESAGIPIVTTAGVNGGIGILKEYKIDKKLFTSQDISTLLTGLNTVSGSMNGATLNQTLEKIKALIPEEQGRAIELDARKLHIDLTPWANNPVIGDNLEMLQKALAENRMVEFAYTTLKQEQGNRRVEPHQLVLKENQWYLRGYCAARQDFRVFKLRRMKDVAITEKVFEPRDFAQKMNDFKEWTHERMIEIELVADALIKDVLLDKCREENMTELGDGKIHVRLPFVESDLGYGYLLQHGEKCECIGPPHVRKELARRIAVMGGLYK